MNTEFVWGAASASYQIEGGATADGRGPSIWDVFSHIPGNIMNNDTGDVACNSYERFEEDLDAIVSIGLKHYRFSISWSRIFPEGTGEVNPAGLAYYDRLVDGCISRGITPWITIFHWDLPQALQERYGGWQSRQIVDDFADYAITIVRHFADRVKYFYIMNEPQCFVTLGYYDGNFAPGIKLNPEGYFACWHHAMLAHGQAVKRIRSEFPDVKLGIASTGDVFYPLTDSEEDIAAAREKLFTMDMSTWHFSEIMYLEPIILGHYPDATGTPLEAAVKAVSQQDLELICQPLDFLGLNMYHGAAVRAGSDGKPERLPMPPGYPLTATKWPITPRIMRYVPQFIGERYGLPIYISENGMSNNDFIFPDGQVHDPQRIAYLESYLDNLKQGIAEGAPVKGYFQWSILDNFEWASGYTERFGLVYVDYATGDRTMKDSAFWLRDYIKNQDSE